MVKVVSISCGLGRALLHRKCGVLVAQGPAKILFPTRIGVWGASGAVSVGVEAGVTAPVQLVAGHGGDDQVMT